MRASSLPLALLLVATLLFAAGCKQQASTSTAEAPAAGEQAHDHEHEQAQEQQAKEPAAPSAEAQRQALAAGEVDLTRFYGFEEINTLSFIAANGDEPHRSKALRILKTLLAKHKNRDVRRSVAGALQGVVAQAITELIEAALHDSDLEVRQACLTTLESAPPTPELVAALDRLRRTDDATIRMAALRTQMGLQLRAPDQAAGLRWIAAQLGDRRDDVSAQASMTLHQQGARSLPACIEVLQKSPNPDARAAAACVIAVVCAGTNPSQQKFAKLSKATQHREVTVMPGPVNLTGLKPLEHALAHDPAPEVRAIAAQGLGYLGQESSAPLLARALHDKNEEVRWWAAQALVTVPAQAAVPDLCAAARSDPSDRVRRAAVSALGWVEASPEVLAALEVATRDRSAEVRRMAAMQLGRLAQPESLDALARLIDDDDEDVRWAAVQAIGELRNPDAAPVLVSVLRDPNPMVANAAERALQKMGIAQRRFGTRDEG